MSTDREGSPTPDSRASASRTPTLHDDDDVVRTTRRYAADGSAPFQPLTAQLPHRDHPPATVRSWSAASWVGGALGLLLVLAVMAGLLWTRAGG